MVTLPLRQRLSGRPLGQRLAQHGAGIRIGRRSGLGANSGLMHCINGGPAYDRLANFRQ
jgi:hypothetical protein